MATLFARGAAASIMLFLTGCGGNDAPTEEASSETTLQDSGIETASLSEPPSENNASNGGDAQIVDETPSANNTPDAEEQPQAEDTPSDTDTTTSLPDGPDKIMIVMDGSGSMWGQIDGTAKMEIARTAFRDLLNGLPENAETGLMAYGHRRKGDCSDIELLQAPTGGTGEALKAAVDAISPRGKTPLSDAVRQAAETLKYEENSATVILVTDGIETCDVDPCALGESLEESGINFTAHVVGFGLSEQEGRQVACLAEETGGRYLEASDAGELSSAMTQVAAAVEAPPAPVEATDQATLIVPNSVQIGQSFEVSWTGPEAPHKHDYIDLVETDYNKTSRSMSWSYTAEGAPRELRAPSEPGVYKVRYVWLGANKRMVIAEAPIEVTDAEAAIFAPESVGIGKEFEIQWRGPDNNNDYVDLVTPDQTATNTQITYAYTRKGETLKMIAPGNPGEFKLRYVTVGSEGERVLTSVPITVDDIRAEVAFNPSVELGSTLEVSWTGPDSRNDYIDIVERGSDATNTQLSYAYTRNGNPAELRVPGEPGEYDVRYIISATSDGERILARAPLTLTETEVSLDFPADLKVGDTLEVNWVGPDARNDYIDIVERGANATNTQLSYAYTRNGNPATLRVPGAAGDYDVRYILQASDGEKVMAVKPLTLSEAEVSMAHTETIALGKMLEVEWTGPGYKLDYIDIVERGFRKPSDELSYAYTRDSIVELQLPAEPGDYDVRFIIAASDGKQVALRQPLTITDVASSLTGPDTAAAGETVEINWEGPGGRQDYIDLAPRGKQLPKDSITYAYTRNGDPVEITLPEEPGDYDLRYIHQGSNKRVVTARMEITVE